MAELPEFKRKEQLQPTAQPMGFDTALTKVAAAGNFLTNIGSEVAIRSSVGRAEIQGAEYGKNPSGELLPALNQTDEAFNKAYRTTAAATLTLQADKLLSDSLIEVAKAPKLTPDLLDSFNKNVEEGIESIVGQAPSLDQQGLRQSLQANLLNANNRLQGKMIEQQKTDSKDTFAAYSSKETSEIFDVAAGGDVTGSVAKFEGFKANVQGQIDSGLLSKFDGQALINAAKITMLTGREYKKAMDADAKGELDVFLSDFAKKQPEDMSPTEWVEVGKNLLNLVSLNDRAEAKNQATLVSESNLRIARGDVDAESIARYQQEMTPDNYNNFLTRYNISLQKNKEAQEQVNYVLNNWDKPGALAHSDPKTINKAFEQMYTDLMNNTGVDAWTAKTLIASSAVVPVPGFIDEMNAMALSGVPEAMTDALHGMQAINSQRPGNLRGLTQDARNMLAMYSQSRAGGQSDVVAAETATKQVLEADQTELNRRKEIWAAQEESIFGFRDAKLSKSAFKMLGVSDKELVDPLGTAISFKTRLRNNFYALGNIEAAKKATVDEFNASHDFSYVNGKKMYVFLPVERVLDITKNELPFVYKQLNTQVEAQVSRFNKLYDSKQSDFKYEFVKNKNISNDQYLNAKTRLEEILKTTDFASQLVLGEEIFDKGGKPELLMEMFALQKTIKAYENPERPLITRIDRDGNKTDFFVNIYAQSEGDLYSGMPVYNVQLESLDGAVQEFIGVNGFMGRNVLYVPNPEQLARDYTEYLDIQAAGGNKAVLEMKKQFQERNEKVKKKIADKKAKSDSNETVIVNPDGNVEITQDDNPTDDGAS